MINLQFKTNSLKIGSCVPSISLNYGRNWAKRHNDGSGKGNSCRLFVMRGTKYVHCQSEILSSHGNLDWNFKEKNKLITQINDKTTLHWWDAKYSRMRKLLEQGYVKERLKSSLREVLWSIRGSYRTIWSFLLTIVKRHSVTWPYTMTTPYWSDFVPNSTFYRILSGFHRTFATGVACRQGTLTPPDTWSRSFGTCICSTCWDQSFSELVVILLDFGLRRSLGTFSILLIFTGKGGRLQIGVTPF